MSRKRTTLTASADDLSLLKVEARRRGVSLGALLGEIVEREAAALRRSRRPRVGVVSRGGSIAIAMEDDPDGPANSGFRSD